MEREKIDKESILYQIIRHESEESAQSMVEKKDELEAQLKAEKDKMADSTEQLAELESKYKRGKKEYEHIEEQMIKAKSDFAVYERKQVFSRKN